MHQTLYIVSRAKFKVIRISSLDQESRKYIYIICLYTLRRLREIKLEFEKINKNRTQFDIMAEMLSISRDAACKTHILYNANLSFRNLEKYLEVLKRRGFLEIEKKGQKELYRTTQRGLDYLANYSKLVSLVSEF